MATCLLIHGSLSGGWCRTKVKNILENRGHTVITPGLPGHETGTRQAPSDVSMDRYVAFVRGLIESESSKVIPAGHSSGGAVITKVIDEIPADRIDRAYFVSAVIPENGDIIGKMLREGSDG